MIDLSLQHELVRILEEEILGLLVAEAVGLALVLGVDRAVGLDVLAERKAHHALVVELTLRGGDRHSGEGKSRNGGQRDGNSRHPWVLTGSGLDGLVCD